MNVQAAAESIASPKIRQWSWLVVALVTLAISVMPLPMGGGPPRSRDLRIVASQYAFSPAVVRVNRGDRVTIDLVSTDVVHGLYLDGYELEVTANPGQTATLNFTADESGVFRFRCSVTCGPLHPFMIGKLNVGNNTLLWRGIALAILATAVGLWRFRR